MSQMKKCKFCQSEIESSAKVCPNCQKDLRNWFARHKIMTGILGLILLIALISVMGGEEEQTNNTTSTTNANTTQQEEIIEPEFMIDAVQLAKEYEENEIRANFNYEDKVAAITGYVSSIGEVLNSTYITLQAEDFSFTQVQCYFEEEEEINKIINLNEGDPLVIVGTIDGLSLNVEVNDCYIVEE